MKEINNIVAGAGIWGCTVARRLVEYKYYDMDKSVEAALKVVVSA